jgi:thiol-disulfide isomerase/thioredoxin
MLKPISLALATLLLLAACGEQPQGGAATTAAAAGPAIARSDFTLPDLEQQPRRFAEWDGQVVLLNFWAPWCPPCREEVPAFIELQEKYGAQGFTIVGVTLDTRDNAQTFADTMGINYPVLIAEEEGITIAKHYGNRVGALPYSVLLDRDGRVVMTQRSELSLKAAEKALLPLL